MSVGMLVEWEGFEQAWSKRNGYTLTKPNGDMITAEVRGGCPYLYGHCKVSYAVAAREEVSPRPIKGQGGSDAKGRSKGKNAKNQDNKTGKGTSEIQHPTREEITIGK